MLRLCFLESARKMMQNGGRVVPIGSIFDMNMKAHVRSMEKVWIIESLVMADPKDVRSVGRSEGRLDGRTDVEGCPS